MSTPYILINKTFQFKHPINVRLKSSKFQHSIDFKDIQAEFSITEIRENPDYVCGNIMFEEHYRLCIFKPEEIFPLLKI